VDRQITERNMRYLVVEIFWSAFFNACVSFNAAYMISLGGSNLLVSLLTSGGALVNAIATMPFSAMVERSKNRRKLMIGSINVMRLGHLGLLVIPWFSSWRAESMLVLLLLLNIPVALFNTIWLPLLGEVIPPARRARVFFARTITLGITVTATTFLMGYWLDQAARPFNYQLMYAFAVVASCLSTVYISRIVAPERPTINRTVERPRLSFSGLKQVFVEHRPFANIAVNTLIFNFALWMAAPLQPIYFVRVLGASDGWIGLWTGLVSGGAILGSIIWSRFIDRRGARWVLVRTTILSSVYYFLIGFFPDLTLILLFGLLAGLVNPGVDLSHVNVLYDVAPEERRTAFMGGYTTLMQVGAFVAPLLVAPLTSLIGAQALILVVASIRLLGGILFAVNPVKPITPRQAEA
jgi:MFS family permease